MRVTLDDHHDLGGAPLTCHVCKVIQSIEGTARDPLMFYSEHSEEEFECDGCRENRLSWPQEVAMSRWEDEQR